MVAPMRASLKVLLACMALGAVVPAAHAATIPVTTTSDVIAQDGQCSLREALFASRGDNAFQGCPAGTSGLDEIRLPAGTLVMAAATAGPLDDTSGDFDTGPLNAVRIVGAGTSATIIDAAGVDRGFRVYPGASLTLQDLTVRGGHSAAGANGGAVFNQGTLVAVRVSFEGNSAGAATGIVEPGGGGGAIWSGGPANLTVLIAESVFRGNAAGAGGDGRFLSPVSLATGGSGGGGGAILIESGVAEVSATTFAGNRAGDGGAGVSGGGGAAAEGVGGDGGAIAVAGSASVSVTNSTFAGNAAGGTGASPFPQNRLGGEGGAAAARSGASLRITWLTFAGNTLSPQAAAGGPRAVTGGQVSASIVADGAPACRLSAPAGLANVVLPGDGSCAGPQITGDPRLGALAANGGSTPTLLPGAGSVAIDALGAGPCPGTDQRGLPRPALGGCDAGAVEIQPGSPSAPGSGAVPAPRSAARTLVPGGGATLRRISGVTLSRTAFRTRGRKPRGTILRVRLTVASRLVLTVTKPAPGRRSRGRCVARTRKLAGNARCTRWVRLRGRLSTAGTAGLNRIAFSGKLRGKALSPGAYRFVLTLPKLGAAKPVVTTKRFRVIR